MMPARSGSVGRRVVAIQDLCRTYLSSYTGANNAGGNITTHKVAMELARGENLPAYQIDELQTILIFRMNLMKLVAEYKNIIGLEYIDCQEFDYETWFRDKCASNMRHKNESLVFTTENIFPNPSPTQGHSYVKPYNYLAAAFMHCGLGPKAVQDAIVKILACMFSFSIQVISGPNPSISR